MSLKSKVAIITGASSGIGKAVAENLNTVGVRFVLTARRKDRLGALANTLDHAVVLPGNITDPALPENLIRTALDAFGSCDIVFNNAGVMTAGTIDEIDVEDICRMVRVNVEAAYRVAYASLKHFKSTGYGFLVNVSSILGTKVRPGVGAYAGTKKAIEALTETGRMEVAKTKISVSCIEPGLVETELHKEWDVHPKESLNIPRPLQPHDVARVVRFLLEQPDHVRIPRVLIQATDHAF